LHTSINLQADEQLPTAAFFFALGRRTGRQIQNVANHYTTKTSMQQAIFIQKFFNEKNLSHAKRKQQNPNPTYTPEPVNQTRLNMRACEQICKTQRRCKNLSSKAVKHKPFIYKHLYKNAYVCRTQISGNNVLVLYFSENFNTGSGTKNPYSPRFTSF
jgi:hypothetical protein